MKRAVYLHGALAAFGERYDLAVRDAPEACRLLSVQLPGFRDTLAEGRWHVFRGPPKAGHTISEEALTLALGRVDEIHIMPAVAGAGDGLLQTIGGVALLAAAPFSGGASLALYAAGGAMALGGVTRMLTSTTTSNYSGREDPDERPSFLFDGPTNTSTQGLPVPLVYGRMRCGSVVVSSGITAEDINLDAETNDDN